MRKLAADALTGSTTSPSEEFSKAASAARPSSYAYTSLAAPEALVLSVTFATLEALEALVALVESITLEGSAVLAALEAFVDSVTLVMLDCSVVLAALEFSTEAYAQTGHAIRSKEASMGTERTANLSKWVFAINAFSSSLRPALLQQHIAMARIGLLLRSRLLLWRCHGRTLDAFGYSI